MSSMSTLNLVFFAYVSLAFAKTMLCYSSVFAALAAVRRRRGADSCLLWTVCLLLGIPLVCFFATPVLLFQERAAFFLSYSRFKVMRDTAKQL